MPRESLTTLLRDWRRRTGVSPEELLQRLLPFLKDAPAPAVRTYYDWEAGKSWPLEPDIIDALHKVTLISVEDLVAGMGYPLRERYQDSRTPQLIEYFEQASEEGRLSTLAVARESAELALRLAAESGRSDPTDHQVNQS